MHAFKRDLGPGRRRFGVPAFIRPRYGLIAAVASLSVALASGAAVAATINNADRAPRTISIQSKASSRMVTVDPGRSLEDVCNDGCVVTIEGESDGEWRLDGSERVTIEDALLYYDGPVAAKDEGASSAER